MLPCHQVILVASIAVAPTPGGESVRASFFFFFFFFFSRKHSVSIELHHNGVIAWRQHRRSCGVFKGLISVAHCPFQRKWRVLHIRYISVLEQVGMSFNGIAYLMQFSFCSSGSSLVFWWCDAPLVLVITFHDISTSTDLYNSYFTRLHLHAVYNTSLTPVTACGSHSTARGIGMRRGKPWIGVSCIFQENIWSENWYFFRLIKKIFSSNTIK